MLALYSLLLLAMLFGGILDNRNVTAFVFLLFFGICALISNLSDKLKKKNG